MTDLQLGIKITADGKSAKAELSSLGGDLSKLGRAGADASGHMDSGFSKARQGLASISRELATARTAFIAYQAVTRSASLAKKVLEESDAYAGMTARLKLVSNSAAQFQSLQGNLYRQAQSGAVAIEDQTALYVKMARATEGTGRSARDLLGVVDIISKGLRISGANTAEAASAVLQFGQAMGSGKIQGQEFMAMNEAAPIILDAVRKSLGLTKAEFRAWAEQGKLSTEVVIESLLKMRGEFDRQAAELPNTFGQAMKRLANSVFEWNAAVAEASGFSKLFTDLANSASKFLDRWAGKSDPVKDQIEAVEAATQKLADEQSRLAGIPVNNLWHVDQQKAVEAATQALAEQKRVLTDLQSQGAKAADPLTEGFGKVAYAIDDVGKKADATMAAIVDRAKKAGVDIGIALAVAQHESGFRQYAQDGGVLYGRDRAGNQTTATGIFQITKRTAQATDASLDVTKANENIELGIELLDRLIAKYKDARTAMAAYYVGEGKIDEQLQRLGHPDFSYAPKGQQTIGEYVDAAMAQAEKFRKDYPGGVVAGDPKVQEQYLKAEYANFVESLNLQETAAKASADRQKDILDTQIAQREEALRQMQQAAQIDLEGRTGGDRTAAATRAAEQEKQALREIAALKAQQIVLDQQAAAVALANIDQQLAAADKLGLTELQRQQLQGQRMQAETDMANLGQRRAQAEIAAGRQIADAELQVTDALRQQAAEQQKAVDALSEYITGLQAKVDALQAGNEQLSEEAELSKRIAALPAGAGDEQIKQAKGVLEEYKKLKKAADDQVKAEKAVADERLRQGQFFQVMVQQAQAAAKSLADAFGEAGAAIGGIWVAFAENAQYAYQIQSQLEDQIAKLGNTEADKQKKIELQSQAANEQLAAQFGMWGQVTGAAKGFFKEGTSGYETLKGASQAFHVAQMAIYVAEQIQSAILGIANQAEGDPYSAFVRMAAMAAAMAALGIAVSGGGGSSGAAQRGARHAQNTGTVLGDSSAASESIANSLKTLKENSSTDLDYSARMTRSLQNIEYAMAGVARSVLVNVNALSGLAGRMPKAGNLGIIPGIKDPLIGDFLFKSSAKIKDFGIGAWPQQLAEILKSGTMQLKTWTDVEFKTSLLGLVTLSKKTKTYLSDASTEMEREFGRVIISLVDALRQGAKAFGMGAEEFMRQLQDFQIQWDAQSLKGLKGEELANAISAQFSAVADKMAAALNIQGLDEFQQIGEGLFETLIRVAGGINQARAELEALNIKMIDYRDITYKQGDVAAELARQSIIAFEGAGSAIGQFMTDAVGSISEIISTYKDLLAIRDAMSSLGFEAKNLSRAMTEAVGGVSKLRDAFESFQSNFLNQGEQLGVLLTTLGREFGNLGFNIPDSKEAFRALVESIDTSTEAGQKLFARLLALSDAFAQAADSAQALQDLLESYTDPLAKFKAPLQKVMDDFSSILSGTLGKIKADFANQATLDKNAFNAPYQAQIDQKTTYISVRQQEIEQNIHYLEVTNARISELQGLIAHWSGVKGAAGYVAAWQKQLEGMQAQAETLRRDIAAKTSEVDAINRQIQDLMDQMAKGDKDIDAASIAARLKELRKAKRDILKAEGDALLQTLRDIWDNMISGIREAQRSIAHQIAELQGPRALDRLTERSATRAYNRAINYKGNDPEEAVKRITDAQTAIMDNYERQVARVNRQLERQAHHIERQYDRLIRHEQKLLQKRIDAINAATDETLKALQKQTDAQVEALNKQMDAELEALDKRYEAEQKVLQQQLDNVRQLQDAIKGINDYLKNLKLGQLSPLSPEDKLSEAQRQFNELLLKAQAGDAQAAAKLSQGSDAYLQAAQSYYGSGPQYAQIFQQVQAALGLVGGMKTTDPDSVQAKIDALREQQKADAEAIRNKYQQQIDAVREAADKTAEAIREAADKQIEHAERRAQRHIRELEKARDKLIRDLSDPEKNEALKKLREKTIAQLQELQKKLEEEEQKARNKMKELIQEVKDLGILNAAQLRQLQKIALQMGAPIEPVPTYAKGGMAKSGLALVGESGPELVDFRAPARVFPALETRTILNGDESKRELEELRRELGALVATQSAANPRLVDALERIDQRISTIERHVRLAA
jgi:tape measure domain-containing protein